MGKKSGTVGYYDPDEGAIIQIDRADAPLFTEAGYKVGKEADIAYRADGVAATGAAALLGAAHGATFGVSTGILNNTLSKTALPYLHAIEDAHPYAYGAGEFLGAGVGFGKIGAAAKGAEALGLAGKAAVLAKTGAKLTEAERAIATAGELRAVGARFSAAALGGGIDAIDAAQTRGADISAEQFVHGVGIGAVMGAFGEAGGAALHAVTPAFQKANNWMVKKAKSSGWFEETNVKVNPPAPEPNTGNFSTGASLGGTGVSPFEAEAAPKVNPTERNRNRPRDISQADQDTINKYNLDTSRYGFQQSQRASMADSIGNLPTVSPEEMAARTAASNEAANAEIAQKLRTYDLAKGQGMDRKLQLTDEELSARAAYFRKYDPTITPKRLANKIALTNKIPMEELYTYAQPEFKYPRGERTPSQLERSKKQFRQTPQGVRWEIEQRLGKDIASDVENKAIRSEFGGGGEDGTEFNVANDDVGGMPRNDNVEREPVARERTTFEPDSQKKILASQAPPDAPVFDRPELNDYVRKGGFNKGPYPADPVSDTPFQGTRKDSGLRDNVMNPHAPLEQIYKDLMSPTYGRFLDDDARAALQRHQERRAVYNLAKKQYTEDLAVANKKLVKWLNKGKPGPSPKMPVEPIKPAKPLLELPFSDDLPAEVKTGLQNLGFKVKMKPQTFPPNAGVAVSRGVAAGFPGQAMQGGHIGAVPAGIGPPTDVYKKVWKSSDTNPLLKWRNNLWTLSGVATAGKVASLLPMVPAVPYLGLAGGTAFAAGIGLKGINEALLKSIQREGASNTVFNTVLKSAFRGAGDVVRAATEQAIPIVENKVFGGEDVPATYGAVTDSLSRMSANPNAVADHMLEQYGVATGDDDVAHGKIVGVSASAIQYLTQMMPKDPTTPALLKRKYTPSRAEMVKFLNIVNALNDPYTALKDPNLDSVKAIESVYPSTIKSVRTQVMSYLLEHPDIELSPHQAKRISVLMGIPATQGMDPNYIGRVQQLVMANRKPQQQQGSAPNSGGRPRQAKVSNNGATNLAAPSQQNAIENSL